MSDYEIIIERRRATILAQLGAQGLKVMPEQILRLGGGGGLRAFGPSFILPYSLNFAGLSDGALPSPLTGATWAISSGKAINTPTVGSEMITNGGFDTDTVWTKATGWTIPTPVAAVSTAGTVAINQNPAMAAHVWYQMGYTVAAYTSGALTFLVGSDGAFTKDRAALGTYVETNRRVATGNGVLYIYANGGAVASIDNVTLKPITLASMMAWLPNTQPDVTIKSACTTTGYSPVGVALNWDSVTAPANGVVGYVTGNNRVRLEKCVAGVWTTLIDGVAVYGAGKVVKVVKSGTSYSLYYGTAGSEVQVGTTQTVSDAGIINNTFHGCFASTGAQLQSFFVSA